MLVGVRLPLCCPTGCCTGLLLATVRVIAPNNRRPGVAVSVVEKNGRIQEQDQEKSDLRFCDLGGLPVTVKVGEDGTCNQVIVREVPVGWEEPYFLSVFYDPVP